MEFAANLRYTLINTALTRFFPHPRPPPPLNKVEVLRVYKICKRCLTWNTQQCSWGEGVNLNYISSPKTRSVPNILTRIVGRKTFRARGRSSKVMLLETIFNRDFSIRIMMLKQRNNMSQQRFNGVLHWKPSLQIIWCNMQSAFRVQIMMILKRVYIGFAVKCFLGHIVFMLLSTTNP